MVGGGFGARVSVLDLSTDDAVVARGEAFTMTPAAGV